MPAILADNIFKCIFFYEKFEFEINFIEICSSGSNWQQTIKGPINNMPALVQIMDCRQICDNPLSEPMMA